MGRRTNLALAVLLVTAVVSGLASQAIGVDWPLDTAVIHGAVALAILLLSPWKTSIVRRGLKKKRPGRVFSLILLTVVLITLASGLLHAHGEISRIGPLTVMQIHVGGAVLALGLAIDHFRRHPVTPRHFDVDRRAFLRTSALSAAAAGIWLAWEGTLQALEAPGRERRFTGMHERGSHDPAGLPTTSWLDDSVPTIDADEWTARCRGTEPDACRTGGDASGHVPRHPRLHGWVVFGAGMDRGQTRSIDRSCRQPQLRRLVGDRVCPKVPDRRPGEHMVGDTSRRRAAEPGTRFPGPDRGPGETWVLVGEMGDPDRALSGAVVASVAVPTHLIEVSPARPGH